MKKAPSMRHGIVYNGEAISKAVRRDGSAPAIHQHVRNNIRTNKQFLARQDGSTEYVLSALDAGQSGLTEKELVLLELLSYGYENGDIAAHFQTSVQAVKNMLRTINLKLGADNRTHAVAISFRNGWLPLKSVETDS